MKKLYILLIAVFVINIAKAQTWTHYTTANGLANNFVEAIAIDSHGNKWIGTRGGVSKFDGINWTTYTTANGLSKNDVFAIAVDQQDNIWCGFGNNGGGVSMFNGTNWTTYQNGSMVYAIAIDAQNNKWFGTYMGGVLKFDGTNWTNYTTADGLGDNYVRAIAMDLLGNIWFATGTGGVSKFDGSNWHTYKSHDGLVTNDPVAIDMDFHGNMWVAFDASRYLSKYDGSQWITYSLPVSEFPRYIKGDTHGNIWTGNLNIYKFDNLCWTTYSNYTTSSMNIDKLGNKWFGTAGNGLWKMYDGGGGPVNSAYIVTGCVFYDLNGNGVKDSGEVALSNKMVEIFSDNIFATTQNNGNYYACLDSGTYQFKCIHTNNWHFTGDSVITVVVNDTASHINNINFGIILDPGLYDVSVDITGITPRPNRNTKYWLTYENQASIAQNGNINIKMDSLSIFISSTPPPVLQNGKTITWNYTNLTYPDQRQIQISMMTEANIGDTIMTTAMINPVAGDGTPANNYDTLYQLVIAAFDPNIKVVDKGVGLQGYTPMNEELKYTIYFQNTGTDTAHLVQIRDTIDKNMDMASLRVISSSHNMRMDAEGRNVVTFIFENIQLPDSNIDEPGSQGFVKYAIKPKASLVPGTVVTNKAYIYFDYNQPVLTNQTINTYVNGETAIREITSETGFYLYPNPATNRITVISPNSTSQNNLITISNIQGQLLMKKRMVQEKTEMDVSGLAKGLYFVKIENTDGIAVKKFIKE